MPEDDVTPQDEEKDTEAAEEGSEKAGDEESSSPEPKATEAASGVPEKRRVLVVEDSTPLRRMLCKILKSDGIEVEEAANGEECLKQIEKFAENPFDLMILDIMMPVLDGIKTMAKVRRENIQNVPPVLICSCRSDRETVELTHKLGALDYILKPFKTDTVLSRVRKALTEEFSFTAEEEEAKEAAPEQEEAQSSPPAAEESSADSEEEKPEETEQKFEE